MNELDARRREVAGWFYRLGDWLRQPLDEECMHLLRLASPEPPSANEIVRETARRMWVRARNVLPWEVQMDKETVRGAHANEYLVYPGTHTMAPADPVAQAADAISPAVLEMDDAAAIATIEPRLAREWSTARATAPPKVRPLLRERHQYDIALLGAVISLRRACERLQAAQAAALPPGRDLPTGKVGYKRLFREFEALLDLEREKGEAYNVLCERYPHLKRGSVRAYVTRGRKLIDRN